MPEDLKDSDFLRLARERYEQGVDAERENREDAEDDLRFRSGDQWPEGVPEAREAEKRPCLTINRMPSFIRQVTGDVRLNSPAIKVRPVDDVADPLLAQTFTGLIRNIEHVSYAQTAYVTAVDNAATCGSGAFRIATEYSNNDNFDQDIRIRRITNPFAVVWDPHAKELTMEDANWCFVVEEMGTKEFKAAYPKASLAEFEADEPSENLGTWWDRETIKVAEYWFKAPVSRTIAEVMTEQGPQIFDITKMPEPERAGLPIEKTREVKDYRVRQVVMSGVEVLEGPFEWMGRYIPIVPVWGEEVHVGRRTMRHGLVRFAKDPQRIYNYSRTASTENVSLAPKAPYIGTVDQFKNLDKYWSKANTANWAFLPYNPDPRAPGRPEREQPPPVQTALAQEAAMASDDMKAVNGLFDASLGARSNETSGRAIIARQREGDVGTFVYIDNLALAISYAGRILVDLIPRIYDSTRIVRVLGEDDEEMFVALNQPATDEGGQEILLNDLSVGEYDVVVDTGPSFSTKREEAAENMMSLINSVPQAGLAAADLIVKNMDFPGAEEISKRLRKLAVAQGIAEPLEGDQPPPPSPQQIMETEKAKAEAEKARGEVAKMMLELEKTEVETEGKELDNAQKALELSIESGRLRELVNQEISRVLLATLGPNQVQ